MKSKDAVAMGGLAPYARIRANANTPTRIIVISINGAHFGFVALIPLCSLLPKAKRAGRHNNCEDIWAGTGEAAACPILPD